MSVHIGGTLTTAFYLGVTVSQFALTTPSLKESWRNLTLDKGITNALFRAISVPSIALANDILLLILPLVAVYKLRIHAKQKLSLVLIFGTGFM